MRADDYDQLALALEAMRQRAVDSVPPLSTFRKLIGSLMMVLSLFFLVLNMIVLAHFGWGLGKSDLEKYVQAAAAGALPLFVTALHPIFVMTWRPAHWAQTASGRPKFRRGRPNWFMFSSVLLLAILALTINFAGGLGVMATARKTVALKSEGAKDEGARLKNSRSELEKELAGVPIHRPVETVEPLLAAHTLHRFWKDTAGCSPDGVMNKRHRDYCGEWGKLKAEIGSAKRAGEIRREMSGLDLALSDQTRISLQAGDAQMEAISNNTGMTPDLVQARLSLLFPLLLELMTVVPMALALGAFRIDQRAMQDIPDVHHAAPPARRLAGPSHVQQMIRGAGQGDDAQPPVPLRAVTIPMGEDPVQQRAVFDQFWATRVRRVTSGNVPEQTFYTHYQAFCAQRSVAPYGIETFRRLSAEHVPNVIEMSGIRFWCHLVVADG